MLSKTYIPRSSLVHLPTQQCEKGSNGIVIVYHLLDESPWSGVCYCIREGGIVHIQAGEPNVNSPCYFQLVLCSCYQMFQQIVVCFQCRIWCLRKSSEAIFLIYHYITIYVCVPHFYDLSALDGCWSSVSIRRIFYKFLDVCPFDYTAVAVSGKVERS